MIVPFPCMERWAIHNALNGILCTGSQCRIARAGLADWCLGILWRILAATLCNTWSLFITYFGSLYNCGFHILDVSWIVPARPLCWYIVVVCVDIFWRVSECQNQNQHVSWPLFSWWVCRWSKNPGFLLPGQALESFLGVLAMTISSTLKGCFQPLFVYSLPVIYLCHRLGEVTTFVPYWSKILWCCLL